MQVLPNDAASNSAAYGRASAKQILKGLTRLYEQFASYDDAVIAICIYGRCSETGEGNNTRCSVSAVSRLTGIPRETVRRRTKAMESQGILVMEGKTYRVAQAAADVVASVCDGLTRPAQPGKAA
jgi:hypothetical protein